MKYPLLILPFMFLVSITGCVSPVVSDVKAFDLDKLRALDRPTLCKDYYTFRKDNSRAEGKSRALMSIENTGFYNLASPEAMSQLETVLLEKGITEEELEAARNGSVFIGMSRDALYAAWGKPYTENRTILANKVRIQHVFTFGGRRYAYTENGFVTAIQD